MGPWGASKCLQEAPDLPRLPLAFSPGSKLTRQKKTLFWDQLTYWTILAVVRSHRKFWQFARLNRDTLCLIGFWRILHSLKEVASPLGLLKDTSEGKDDLWYPEKLWLLSPKRFLWTNFSQNPSSTQYTQCIFKMLEVLRVRNPAYPHELILCCFFIGKKSIYFVEEDIIRWKPESYVIIA